MSDAPGRTPMIEVRGARKAFGAAEVLRGIDLTVGRGEIVAIIGPSGSGKSTLLRAINHLETLDAGEIRLDGRRVNLPLRGRAFERHVNALRRQIGMVFQQFNLFPHLTAVENVALGPRLLRGLSGAEAQALAMGLLARVGLADKADAWPARLSGGQKQRVAIARALAMEPKVMLFDEATSALDPDLVDEVNAVIRDLAAGQMTMLIVTHEMRFAAQVADRVVFLEGGVVVEEGSAADIFSAPREARTRSFLRRYLER